MHPDFFRYFGVLVALVGFLFVFLGMDNVAVQVTGLFSVAFGMVLMKIRKK